MIVTKAYYRSKPPLTEKRRSIVLGFLVFIAAIFLVLWLFFQSKAENETKVEVRTVDKATGDETIEYRIEKGPSTPTQKAAKGALVVVLMIVAFLALTFVFFIVQS